MEKNIDAVNVSATARAIYKTLPPTERGAIEQIRKALVAWREKGETDATVAVHDLIERLRDGEQRPEIRRVYEGLLRRLAEAA